MHSFIINTTKRSIEESVHQSFLELPQKMRKMIFMKGSLGTWADDCGKHAAEIHNIIAKDPDVIDNYRVVVIADLAELGKAFGYEKIDEVFVDITEYQVAMNELQHMLHCYFHNTLCKKLSDTKRPREIIYIFEINGFDNMTPDHGEPDKSYYINARLKFFGLCRTKEGDSAEPVVTAEAIAAAETELSENKALADIYPQRFFRTTTRLSLNPEEELSPTVFYQNSVKQIELLDPFSINEHDVCIDVSNRTDESISENLTSRLSYSLMLSEVCASKPFIEPPITAESYCAGKPTGLWIEKNTYRVHPDQGDDNFYTYLKGEKSKEIFRARALLSDITEVEGVDGAFWTEIENKLALFRERLDQLPVDDPHLFAFCQGNANPASSASGESAASPQDDDGFPKLLGYEECRQKITDEEKRHAEFYQKLDPILNKKARHATIYKQYQRIYQAGFLDDIERCGAANMPEVGLRETEAAKKAVEDGTDNRLYEGLEPTSPDSFVEAEAEFIKNCTPRVISRTKITKMCELDRESADKVRKTYSKVMLYTYGAILAMLILFLPYVVIQRREIFSLGFGLMGFGITLAASVLTLLSLVGFGVKYAEKQKYAIIWKDCKKKSDALFSENKQAIDAYDKWLCGSIRAYIKAYYVNRRRQMYENEHYLELLCEKEHRSMLSEIEKVLYKLCLDMQVETADRLTRDFDLLRRRCTSTPDQTTSSRSHQKKELAKLLELRKPFFKGEVNRVLYSIIDRDILCRLRGQEPIDKEDEQ